jgi:hypothetical protein
MSLRNNMSLLISIHMMSLIFVPAITIALSNSELVDSSRDLEVGMGRAGFGDFNFLDGFYTDELIADS